MLIIDAYNVLHVTGVLPPELAGPDLQRLAVLLTNSRFRGQRVVLVCDGAGAAQVLHRSGGDRGGRVEVVYAGRGREADDAIERLLAEPGPSRGQVTVVSTDRRLRRAAKRRGVKWMSSERLLEQLAADHAASQRRRPGLSDSKPAFATDIPLDAESVRHWIASFGLRADDEILKLASSAGQPVSLTSSRPAAEPFAEPPVPNPPAPPGPRSPPDPLLLEALKEWPGRLSLDDLDMSRWLKS